MKQLIKDKLVINIYESRNEMGKAAGVDAVNKINKLLEEKEEINIIFAAAPSQNEMLTELRESNVDFSRINAYHMDEYIGLPKESSQSFRHFLDNTIFNKVKFKSINYINCEQNRDIHEEIKNYSNLLEQNLPDITLMGIGENGHIAFNDPHVADFNDKVMVKKVALDHKCRMQQVNDGCFDKLEDVPKYALTLTIPALIKAKHIICTVPGASKCEALTTLVKGDISESCPGSILRVTDNAVLFCDNESGKHL